MSYFNIVTETTENTVVTEYKPDGKRAESYQSEAELEREFIAMLCAQGYEYLSIHTETDLIDNLWNNISEGLPAEIAARQKQYEYYRDKLLTFNLQE